MTGRDKDVWGRVVPRAQEGLTAVRFDREISYPLVLGWVSHGRL